MVLKTLGVAPVWIGFSGGANGASLEKGLRELGVQVEPVPTAEETRTNLEIVGTDGPVTEILEPGPTITAPEIAAFQRAFERLLANGENNIVILSGSLPPGVPADFYGRLIRFARESRSRVFLDSSGEAFHAGLLAAPDFVKPNHEEAEAWAGSMIDGPDAANRVLQKMLAAGAQAGAISLGADGLICASRTNEKILLARPPKQVTRSCVGCGDATLAGFAFAAAQGCRPEESARLAVACGAANCLADGPGRASSADIARLQREIEIELLA
jgi:1-phosphofructokinase family hexose kinase